MKDISSAKKTESLGIYFHIPFCKRKCDYCDFTTVRYDKYFVDEYLIYLLRELELYKSTLKDIDKEEITIYFGGGSPSLFPHKYIEKLINKICATTKEPIEVTLESNPWELTDENLGYWKKIGITRLSVGVQSTDRKILNNVGRESPVDIEKRLEKARLIFDEMNVDFILGLPEESWKSVKNNIQLIEKIKPEHISYYIFDKDHDTPLMRKHNNAIIKLPDVDLCERLHDYILTELNKLNYIRYEISSWSFKGKECQHNLSYWKNSNYIGCGISAGGHLNNLRYVNHVDLNKYEAKLDSKRFPYEFSNENSFFEEFIERIFMGLRLKEGIRITDFMHDSEIKLYIRKLLKNNSEFLEIKGSRLKLTDKGFDVSRSVFESIISTKEEMNDVFRT